MTVKLNSTETKNKPTAPCTYLYVIFTTLKELSLQTSFRSKSLEVRTVEVALVASLFEKFRSLHAPIKCLQMSASL